MFRRPPLRPPHAAAIGLLLTGGIHTNCDSFKAEELYNQSTFDRRELLLYLRKISNENPTDVEILWRLARAEYDVANLNATKSSEKKELIYAAQKTVSHALSLSDDNAAVHKWFGIITSSIGDFEGTKVSIANSYVIKNHWQKAIELNPKDATAYHLLGRWCMNIADISWIQRKAAQTLFGTPPESSVEEALTFFLQAEEISPGFWKKNMVMIAICYIKLKQAEKAQEWLTRALALPIVTEEDSDCHEEAQTLLSG